MSDALGGFGASLTELGGYTASGVGTERNSEGAVHPANVGDSIKKLGQAFPQPQALATFNNGMPSIQPGHGPAAAPQPTQPLPAIPIEASLTPAMAIPTPATPKPVSGGVLNLTKTQMNGILLASLAVVIFIMWRDSRNSRAA